MTDHSIHGIAEAAGYVKDETYALLVFKNPPKTDYMTYNESVEHSGTDDFNGIVRHDVTFDVWCRSRSSLEETIESIDSIMDENAVWMDGGFKRESASYLQEHDLWNTTYTFSYTAKSN